VIFSVDGYAGPPLDGGVEAGPGDSSLRDRPADRPADQDAAGRGCPLPFSAAVLADQPIVYYPMDEGPGDTTMNTRAVVSVAYAATYGPGVELGSQGLLPSEPGVTSPHFRGGLYNAMNSAKVPMNLALEPGSALTVELVFEEDIVNPGPTDTGNDGYIDLADLGWSAQITPINTMKFYLPTVYCGKANFAQVTGGMSLVPHQVHLYDATYDGFSTATVYLDAVIIASASPPSNQGNIDYAGAGGLEIGGAYGPDRWILEGQIAQVSLYSTNLSPDRIRAHYEATGLDGTAVCPSD
jgi:hypothetical protein